MCIVFGTHLIFRGGLVEVVLHFHNFLFTSLLEFSKSCSFLFRERFLLRTRERSVRVGGRRGRSHVAFIFVLGIRIKILSAFVFFLFFFFFFIEIYIHFFFLLLLHRHLFLFLGHFLSCSLFSSHTHTHTPPPPLPLLLCRSAPLRKASNSRAGKPDVKSEKLRVQGLHLMAKR